MATMNKPARGSTNWQTDVTNNWTSIENNLVDQSILTTKGDLLGASAAAIPARVGVGTDGQILSADSTKAAGLAWITFSSDKAVITSRAQATTATSTTSTTYVDMDSMSLSVTVGTGGTVLIFFSASIRGASSNAVTLRILRGTTEIRVVTTQASGSWVNSVGFFAVDAPGPGTYTYKVQWLVSAGTGFQDLGSFSSSGDRELVAAVLPA
jgi:hypothetical protein